MNKKQIELAWIIAVLVILLSWGAINIVWIGDVHNSIATENNHVSANNSSNVQLIKVQGTQWSWTFTNSSGVSTTDAFNVTVNKTVELVVTSVPGEYIAVIHDLLIPQMGIQIYAVPGQNNTIEFTPTHTGVFFFECVEYCGELHYEMRGYMTVVK
ncbi:MAG: hypothetical protein M1402_03410 [Candidatus Thermoplasmatota archaeon]|nr:hypothetical protein [Candidatus Thermoplasmatota archaeon]MCL5666063.1 hypothetical protein [Candidatus Thermoplasmatota archaeon]